MTHTPFYLHRHAHAYTLHQVLSQHAAPNKVLAKGSVIFWLKQVIVFSVLFCCTHGSLQAICIVPKPVIQTVTVTSCDATISWLTVVDAAYYRVRYKKLPGGTWITVNVGTVTTYSLSGLLPNTKYEFEVASYCADNTTLGYSPPTKKTTQTCSIPINPVVSAISNIGATISWSEPCGTLSFTVQYRKYGVALWTTVNLVYSPTYTITGLEPGLVYQYKIQAVCAGATTAFTSIHDFTTTNIALPPPPRPNILVIVTDDSRYDQYSANGGPAWFITPSISRIAEEGANFKYTCAATPLCAPSRATIYTGVYPHKNGCEANGDKFNAALPKIQQILTDNGYYTGFVGKYGQGFGAPVGFNWWAISNSDVYVNPPYQINGRDTTIAGNIIDSYPNFCLDFLNSAPADAPWMLMFFHRAPHADAVPRASEDHLYEADTIPLPGNFYRYPNNYPSFFYTTSYLWTSDSLATVNRKREEFQTLKGVDDNLDTIFQWLEDHGMMDNTLIIYSSDNGYLEGEHMLGTKGIAQEESLRLPMFARYPSWFSPNTVIDNEIAANVDIPATMLDAAGIDNTFGFDGISLRQLANHSKSRKVFMYEEGGKNDIPDMKGVRTLTGKYIKSFCDQITDEYYDLAADPNENVNHINDPGYASTINYYKFLLDSMRTVLSDTEVPTSRSCHLVLSDEDGRLYADEPEMSNMSIQPNPAGSAFIISIDDENMDNPELTIYNEYGSVVVKQTMPHEHTLYLNCNSWSNGIYYASIEDGKNRQVKKITILK